MREVPVSRSREPSTRPVLPDHVSQAVFGFAPQKGAPLTIVFRASVRDGFYEAVLATCCRHPRACEPLLMALYEAPRFESAFQMGETEDGEITIDVPDDLRGGI